MLITFKVEDQKITHDLGTRTMVAGSDGNVQAAFSFDSTWDGLDIVVVFTNSARECGGKAIKYTGETFNIPSEVLIAGKLYVSVIGFGSNDSRKTTQKWDVQQAIIVQECGAMGECDLLRYMAQGEGADSDAPTWAEVREKPFVSLGDGLTVEDGVLSANVDGDHILEELTLLLKTANKLEAAQETLQAGKADKATTLAGYGITDGMTAEEIETAISTAVAKSEHVVIKVAETVPAAEEAEANVLYLVKNEKTGYYDIYALVGDEVILLDDTSVDLSDYPTTEEMNKAIADATLISSVNEEELTVEDKKLSIKAVPQDKVTGLADTLKNLPSTWDALSGKPFESVGDGLTVTDGVLTIDMTVDSEDTAGTDEETVYSGDIAGNVTEVE